MATNQEMLDLYIAAEQSVLRGKDVWFDEGGTRRRLTKEDLPEIRKGRQEWQQRVNADALAAGGVQTLGGRGFAVARFD
ncbi:MAG TPA: hypothetical protein VEA40_07480 [Ramlibacter sp.]|nr:hypothetical protein [Ramlibacter sp.]